MLDFLSLGTNDLSQYALAMDRGNAALAGAIDALHPAVLRLIKATVDGAKKHGKPVSVCGAAASDLDAAPILIGLGVSTLSAVSTAAAIPSEEWRWSLSCPVRLCISSWAASAPLQQPLSTRA